MNELLEVIRAIPTNITIHHPNIVEHTWCPLCGLDYVLHEHRTAGNECPWCRGDAERAKEGQVHAHKLLADLQNLDVKVLELLVNHVAGGYFRAKVREELEKRLATELEKAE